MAEDIIICSPAELLVQERQTEMVDTGAESLNTLLRGGLRLGEVTEAYGAFNTGKSQLAFTLCVNLWKFNPSYGTLFIDTEDTFRSSRIVEICRARKADEREVLDSIKLVRVKSAKQQIGVFDKLDRIFESQPNVRLVVIDSLIAHLRAQYLGRAQLAKRQQILANMLHQLGQAVAKHKIGVYLTNQVGTDPNRLLGDPTFALGGNVLAHFSQTRLYFRNGRKGLKVAKLTDSSCLPTGEAVFTIKTEGISD